MAEAASAVSQPQNPRNNAAIITDWVTSLRHNALKSLRCGAVMGYSESDCPIPLRVANDNHRIGEDNIWCIDRKISSYGVKYFYTFIAKVGFLAIQEWLEWRKRNIGSYDAKDPLFCTVDSFRPDMTTLGSEIRNNSLYTAYKNGVKHVGINPATTTIHKLRDSFKSVMIRAGVDSECREAMMAHPMQGSGRNYFDNNDLELVMHKYMQADWSRAGQDKVVTMEKRLDEIKAQLSLAQQQAIISQQAEQIQTLTAQLKMLQNMFTVNLLSRSRATNA